MTSFAGLDIPGEPFAQGNRLGVFLKEIMSHVLVLDERASVARTSPCRRRRGQVLERWHDNVLHAREHLHELFKTLMILVRNDAIGRLSGLSPFSMWASCKIENVLPSRTHHLSHPRCHPSLFLFHPRVSSLLRFHLLLSCSDRPSTDCVSLCVSID